MTVQERLTKLRQAMTTDGINGFIIPSSDPHMSEYVAPRFATRAYFSGFSGSAGTLVVLEAKAALWTDSRYWTEAGHVLQGTGIELMRDGDSQCPSMMGWLLEQLGKDAVLAYDGGVVSSTMVQQWEKGLDKKHIRLEDRGDIPGSAWNRRPGFPARPVQTYQPQWATKTARDKLDELAQWMDEKGIQWYLVSALDELAWLLQLRGSDVQYNPVFYGYLLFNRYQSTLCIQNDAVNQGLSDYLDGLGITIAPYQSLGAIIQGLPSQDKIIISPQSTSIAIARQASHMVVSPEPGCLPLLKACKDQAELSQDKLCHKNDALSLIEWYAWIRQSWEAGHDFNEHDVGLQIAKLRGSHEDYRGESFSPIVGFGAHGAIVHYSAKVEGSAKIKGPGLLLLDTGAQYLGGTTDSTRTLVLGPASADQKKKYTLVLKGHLALARAIFPKGTSGNQLDVLARQSLWQEGLNYGHGTGHGVGFYLNVHEGPQRIAPTAPHVPLEPGMIISNEPGYYQEGSFGIRIENLVFVEEHPTLIGFLRFGNLTMLPYEPELIDPRLLTKEEKHWLEAWNANLLEELMPQLSPLAQKELQRACTMPWKS